MRLQSIGFKKQNFGIFKKYFLKIYFWPHWVFVSKSGLFLVVASGGYSVVVVHELLIVVASLVVAHGL